MKTPMWTKLLQLVGVALLLVGVIARAGADEYWGVGLALLGLVLFAVGRIAAWLKVG